MKQLVPVLLLLLCSQVFAQTKLVAHRSHSGTAATFSSREEGNFGWIEPRQILKKVIRLSDTTAIEVFDVGRDTTVRHPYWNNPRIRLDSLKKLFPDISFEGFESTSVTAEAPSDRGTLPLVVLSVGVSAVVARGIIRRRG
jgi:hypothetical protein